jgi:uncharacterized protein involved in exopolysaccharide biosynthesis
VSSDNGYALDGERHLMGVIGLCRTLWGYRYLILLTTAAFASGAIFIGFTATPVYRAEATVMEVTDGGAGAAASLVSQIGGLASLVGVNLSSGGGGRESQALLKSRHLAEDFIVRHDLVPVLFGQSSEPPTFWRAVQKFQGGVLTIRDDKRTGLGIVSVSWTDPAVAAKWANAYVALANEELRDKAIGEAKASVSYLNAQIAQTNVVELQRVMYALIENQTKTLMLANARADYAFALVDPAVPPEIRESPRRRLLLVLGVALGGLLGVVLAVGHNLWRQYQRFSRPKT